MCVSTNTPSRSSYARPSPRSWCRESPSLATPVLFFFTVKGCSGLDRQKRRFSSTCCWRKGSSRQRNKGWFLRLSGPVSWSGSSAQVASDLCVGTSPPILRFFLGGGVALHERLVGDCSDQFSMCLQQCGNPITLFLKFMHRAFKIGRHCVEIGLELSHFVFTYN